MSVSRRAQLDEKAKKELQRKVRELLKSKKPQDDSSEQKDDVGGGVVYLFDEPITKPDKKVVASIIAREFPTEDARNTYFKDHPGADKSKHKVVKTQKEPGQKDEPTKERGPAKEDLKKQRGPAEDESTKKREPAKEEQKKDRAPAKEEAPVTRSPAQKEESKKEEKPEPGYDHPLRTPKGPSRQLAIKDHLIDQFGSEAKDWNTHSVDKVQLTEETMIHFPDGSKKSYKSLTEDEKNRVHKALDEGLAAHKGLNDYSSADIGTLQKNMKNNLGRYDTGVEETTNTDTEPVTKDNAGKFLDSVRENGRNVLRKYLKSMSVVSRPMAERHIDEVASCIQEGINDGSLAGVSQADLDSLVREDTKRLLHQEVETRGRSLGDHGVRHCTANSHNTISMLDELKKSGIKITGKQKLMGMSIQANHDLGYTVGKAGVKIKNTGDHPKQGEELARQDRSRFDKVFGKEDTDKLIHIIGTHDSNEIDWEQDPVGSSVRLADNTSLFGKDKVQDLFIRSSKAMGAVCKLRLAAQSGDKELQDGIKKQLHEIIDTDIGDDSDRDDMHREVDEMSEEKFSTSKDILSRYSGRLEGYAYDGGKKLMTVNMKYSPEGQMVDQLFGDDVAAKQFDKFADSLSAAPVRGKHGNTVFLNDKKQPAFQMTIDGFDSDPEDSATTTEMKGFLQHTVRAPLQKASALLKSGGSADKAKKLMEDGHDRFTDAEWDKLEETFKESDPAKLAEALGNYPLIAKEKEYLGSRTASAIRVMLSSLSDRVFNSLVAGRGHQVRRKDKDLMSDGGGNSKRPEREPEFKPPRTDCKDRYRTKDKPTEQHDSDIDKDKDHDRVTGPKEAADMGVAKALRVLAMYPVHFADIVYR